MCCNVASSSLPADYATVFEMFLIHFDAIYGVNRFNKPFIIFYFILLFPSPNICLYSPSVNSGWARLAAYMDHIYSTKPLNSPGMANRGFCLSETFSSSDVNRRILFAQRSFSCYGKKGRASNFYPAPNFISYPRILPRDGRSPTER